MNRRTLFLLLSTLLTLGAALAADIQVGPQDEPDGAVVLVVDGLGSSYVYPEQHAYALDGSLLPGAVLFNLTGGGARAVDVRVPVPETTKSHSVLITGNAETNPDRLGPTAFDAARKNGYLCLAVLERGDSMPVLQEMDAVLYLGDNAMHGSEPTTGFRAGAPEGLFLLLQKWRDRFAAYSRPEGVAGYVGYDAWAMDAAADMVKNLSDKHFLMLVNVGAVDSAGHNLGADGYLEVVCGLDGPLGHLAEACKENNVLLVVTADHGMVFPDEKGKGGHSAEKYSGRLEALRVPLVFFGPGVKELNLGGLWHEMDIAPTVLGILDINGSISSQGRPLPVRDGYSLQVTGAPDGLTLMQGERQLAIASAGECRFIGLPMGVYTLLAGEKKWTVTVDGDTTADLGEKNARPESMKRILGVIFILAINLAGTALIIRIWRKDG